MKFDWKYYYNHPAIKVFITFRERTIDFAKHIPNIKGVKILEKKEVGEKKVRLLTEWHAKAPIPLIAKAIVKPEMLKWKEDDLYDENDLTLKWVIIPNFFKEFFSTGGEWVFRDIDKNRCEVNLKGFINVYIPHFPGVPDSIAHAAGGIIEKTIAKYLKPNIDATNKAISKLLDSNNCGV